MAFVARSRRVVGGLKPLLLLLLVLLGSLAFAHPANVPVSTAKVKPDGTLTLRIRFDAIAFATGAAPKDADDDAMTALIDGPEETLRHALAEAAGRFRRGMVIGNGGEIDSLEFPTVGSVRRFLAGNPSPRLPVMLETIVHAHLPKGTRSVSFRYPDAFGVVIQTVEFPYQEPISEPVEPGATSRTLTIPTAEKVARLATAMNAPRVAPTPNPTVEAKAPVAPPVPEKPESTPVVKKASEKPPVKPEPPASTPTKPDEGSPAAVVASPNPPPVDATPIEPAPVASSASPALTYLKMGFTHILPSGIDHILFVLGLFLLGSNMKALMTQVTAFTVAHSITLALATLGVVHVPGRVIEPLIALSIAFVAVENLLAKEVKPRRAVVVFLFGLFHGLGFAEVFADAGLRGSGLVTALLSFNVGVELGQIAVIAIALGAVGWFRKDARYRKVVVVPASVAIGALALFWTVERVIG